MKSPIVLVVIGLIVIGTAFWLFNRDTDSLEPVPIDTTNFPGMEGELGTEPIVGEYVGLTETEAEVLASSNDVPFRVVERDGETLPTTRDFRPGRINAVVESEVVTSYTIEGMEIENGGNTNIEEGAHDEIIGMTEIEAEAYALANNVSFRIGARDGVPLAVTMDLRPGRITAEIESGLVTGYTVE